MPDRFLNLRIMAHPLNWITLFLWVAFLGILISAADPMLKGMYTSTNSNGAV